MEDRVYKPYHYLGIQILQIPEVVAVLEVEDVEELLGRPFIDSLHHLDFAVAEVIDRPPKVDLPVLRICPETTFISLLRLADELLR